MWNSWLKQKNTRQKKKLKRVFAECVSRWGRGQGCRSGAARRGAGGAYSRPCPLLPSARCGGRSVNLNAAFTAHSASPGRGQRGSQSVLSVGPPPLRFRSTYRRRSSWTLRVRVQKKVPNAERSTRCPGANLEANRSTWVQFKVSRRKQRRVGTLKQFGDGCDDVGFVCFLKIGETKINSGHSFISLSAAAARGFILDARWH